MRRASAGWRSARSAMAVAVGARTPAAGTRAVAHAPVAAAAELEPLPHPKPWVDVKWSIPYVAFLAYMFAITTYALPIATAAMIIALLGVFVAGKFRFPAMLGWMTAFVAWCGLSYIQTEYPDAAWLMLVQLFKIWLVVIVAVNAMRSAQQLRFFTILFLGCFALWPIRGALFNYYFYGQKWMGRAIWQFGYGNPNDLAAFCLFQVGLATCVLVTETNVWIRRAALLGLAMLPMMIFLTQSRGSLLGLGFFAITAILGHRRELARVFGRAYLRRLAVGLAIVGVVVFAVSPNTVWQRLAGLRMVASPTTLRQADADRSAEQRWEIWKVTRRVAAEHPVFGVGTGAYPFVHWQYVQFNTRNFFAGGRRDAHSTYLLTMAETGYIGFIFFTGIILSTLIYVRRVRRRARYRMPKSALQLYYLQNAMIAFLIAGMFGSFSYLHLLYIYLAVCWAWAKMVSTKLAAAGAVESAARSVAPVQPALNASPGYG